MDQNAIRNVRLTGKPSLTSLRGQFEARSTFLVVLSFLAGVLVALGVFSSALETESSETASRALSTEAANPELSRQAVDAGIEAEVAGVSCDDLPSPIDLTSTALDVVEAWNETVVAAADECTPDFQGVLGGPWLMTDFPIAIFGNAGSLFELSAGDDELINDLTIVLVEDDASNREQDLLVSVIETLWGSEAIDWELPCADSDSAWAGILQADDLTIQVTRCEGA